MRGARKTAIHELANFGLIPARAGSTTSRCASERRLRAHPRPCGEHWDGEEGTVTALGSSPPVRGAPANERLVVASHGLIPARAGSTYRRPCYGSGAGAHPRPCGEHIKILGMTYGYAGSSPPVRGARISIRYKIRHTGLIPARAGSTVKVFSVTFWLWAHPRPCGEHKKACSIEPSSTGSSPPVRGALNSVASGFGGAGLIPARAGSTIWWSVRPGPCWAHPRPCGEHRWVVMRRTSARGSSPPVRGAHKGVDRLTLDFGLIPARAGSTDRLARRTAAPRAHPRPCGEHRVFFMNASRLTGSSPPVRGAHLLTWGFIPYTGKIGLLWSQSLRPEYTINNCS